MLPEIRFSAAVAISILLVASGPLRAQFPLITYELQAGSSVVDECVNCFRPTLELQIKGTLVLQRLPVRIAGELYAISALELSCSNCPGGIQYDFQGEGQLYRRSPETEATTLNLSLNGVSGIVLQNEQVPSAAPWPLIDVTVTEEASGTLPRSLPSGSLPGRR